MWLFELRWNPPITADIRGGIQNFVQGIVALYDYWNPNGDRIFLQRASCETPRILNLWRRYPTKRPTFVTHRGCGSPESDIKSASGPFTEVFDSSQVPAIIYINHCPTSGDSRRSWHHWWNFESDAWWAGPGSTPLNICCCGANPEVSVFHLDLLGYLVPGIDPLYFYLVITI